MAHRQEKCCFTPAYQVHGQVTFEITQSNLTRAQGFPRAFPPLFHLPQTCTSVKWKSKEDDLVWEKWQGRAGKGRGRAGAAAFCTPKRFPRIKAAAGPHSRSSWSCQRGLSDWWRDRLQIDGGVARTQEGVERLQSASCQWSARDLLSLCILWPPSQAKTCSMWWEWNERNVLHLFGMRKSRNASNVSKREEGSWAKPCKESFIIFFYCSQEGLYCHDVSGSTLKPRPPLRMRFYDRKPTPFLCPMSHRAVTHFKGRRHQITVRP